MGELDLVTVQFVEFLSNVLFFDVLSVKIIANQNTENDRFSANQNRGVSVRGFQPVIGFRCGRNTGVCK